MNNHNPDDLPEAEEPAVPSPSPSPVHPPGELAPTLPIGDPNAIPATVEARDLIARGLQAPTNPGGWTPPTPGELSLLLPQYEIDALIGRGGMGAVYKGRQAALDRPVAIKLLPAEMAANPDFVARFQREARTLAKLQHPGIVMVHDFGQTPAGHLYFVMEFVDGTDLHKIIHGPGLDCSQALEIVGQICDALQYAHDQGVVHRDIKPANVILNRAGRAKLADFGLARPLDEGSGAFTRSNVVMGTLDYMAPEALAGEADHRADLYALGVMLYEMLTGKPPRGAWAPPSQRVQVDVRLDEVVVRALQENPDLRYQQASEIKTDVDVIRTTPLPKAEKGKKQPRKKSGAAAWIAVLLLLPPIGGGVYWGFVKGKTKPDQIPAAEIQSTPRVDDAQNRPPLLPAKTPDPRHATKDAPFVNSLGMKFVPVLITGGPTDGQRVLFSIWETRVADYTAFAQATNRKVRKPTNFEPQPEDHPVVDVSREDGIAFCEWLTSRDQSEGRLDRALVYRLPSDHEWSCAVAIGDREDSSLTPKDKGAAMKDAYPWGTEWPPPAGSGNYLGEERPEKGASSIVSLADYRDGFAHTAPVGQYRQNALGMYDLGGNVWELTSDWFDRGQAETRSVIRGGCFNNGDRDSLRSAFRGYIGTRDPWHDGLGFRVVLGPSLPAAMNASNTPSRTSPNDSTPAQATKDTPFVNSLGMKFVPVPITGGPTDGQRVLFSIWETRVQDYEAFVKETKRDWPKLPFEQGPTHPAVMVSWEDSTAFCVWLTTQELRAGRIGADECYRLPTDHEWSCAVGIGGWEDPLKSPMEKQNKVNSVFAWGTDWPPPPRAGNFAGEELREIYASGTIQISGFMPGFDDGFKYTAPVGSFNANKLGLFDLAGNVWEWMEDWADSRREKHFLRGGSWGNPGRQDMVASARLNWVQGPRLFYGFRIVLAPPLPASSITESAPADSVRAVPSTATKDTPFVNSLGMKFVPVPITGGPTDGQRVLFSIWETRVQDYEIFAQETRRPWRSALFEQGSTHPAIRLSWADATAFCAWLTERERKAGMLAADDCYRLPSDHEWSCAVGIGGQEDAALSPEAKDRQIMGAYPWGGEWPPPKGSGNYYGVETKKNPINESRLPIEGFEDAFERTAPVGSFAPDPHGLFDLGGNISEWCDDWVGGNRNEGVQRGGSWFNNNRQELASSYRARLTVGEDGGGFRCVLSKVVSLAADHPATDASSPAGTNVAAATKDTPFVNSLGMKFVPVPITGGPTDGKRVLFSIWETRVQDYRGFALATKRDWPAPEFNQADDHPAVNMSWDDATAFCAWLTERERAAGTIGSNDRYRLPGDHEWSCAVGIGHLENPNATPEAKNGKFPIYFPWGEGFPPPPGAGNYYGKEMARNPLPNQVPISEYDDGFIWTAPVGSFTANSLGLHDLGGNVNEWCEDWFDPAKQERRVLRGGGSWGNGQSAGITSSRRDHAPPPFRHINNGFRCVLATASSPVVAQSPSSAFEKTPWQDILAEYLAASPAAKGFPEFIHQGITWKKEGETWRLPSMTTFRSVSVKRPPASREAVRAVFSQAPSEDWTGVVLRLRSDGEGTSYMAVLTVMNGDGQAGIQVRKKNATYALAPVASIPGFKFNPSSPYAVEFQIDRGKLTVLLDGKIVASTTDAAIPPGGSVELQSPAPILLHRFEYRSDPQASANMSR